MRPSAYPRSVSTYEDAQAWLWGHSRVEDWLFDPDATLPPEALLVCAIYWVSPSVLCRDLRKSWHEVAGEPSHVPPRHLKRAGWRHGV